MVNGNWTLKKQKEVLGGFDPNVYESKRIFAQADDGTRVPISLMYRIDLKDGTNPSFYTAMVLIVLVWSLTLTRTVSVYSNAVLSLPSRIFAVGRRWGATGTTRVSF